MDANQINQNPESKTPQPDVLPTGVATEQTPPVPPSPPPVTPQKSVIPLLLTILFLLALAATIILAIQNRQLQKQISAITISIPPPLLTATPTPTPTTDPTADWKTYTSERYLLSFKYPPQRSVNETDWMIDILDSGGNIKMRTTMTSMATQETQDEFVARRQSTDTQVRKNHLRTTQFSYPAITYEEMSQPSEAFLTITAIFTPKYTYEVFPSDSDPEGNQILSTFKFL